MKRTLTFLFAISVFATALAQKPVKVCGECTYKVPENISLQEAKQIALKCARDSGMISKFGQRVYQENSTFVSNRNGKSSIDFYSYGGSSANGDWIEDTEEPKYSVSYEQGLLVVKASVCGMAKEIKSAGIDLKVHVLRNRWELQYESDHFYSGDSVYLYFQSPVDGYVTVYCINRDDQTVWCMLPVIESPQGAVEVKHDKEYVFFRQNGYTLETTSGMESDDIYIVFSPNPYSKPILTITDNERVPGEISFKNFSEWLSNCHRKDKDMTEVRKPIKIIKRQ